MMMILSRKNSVVIALLLWCANSYAITSEQRPLNILFVVSHFPAPSQIFILNIITSLIDRGHNVSIFSFNKDKNVPVHSDIHKYHLFDRVTYGKLPDNMPDYDIVFCQFGYVGRQIFNMKELKKWLKKRKVVVCFRGSDTTAYVQKYPTAYNKLFKYVDLCLPVCDYFGIKLKSLGCDPRKILVHHSAIDCSRFFFKPRQKPQRGTIKLIAVCRLVKKKGMDYAIKAVAQLVKKYPDIHFTIVGDGPERHYLQKLIRQLDLTDKVTLYGWASQEEVAVLLDTSHIFLLPSLTTSDGNEEGIANALKEAMAMGLISIATTHAGTPELVEDKKSGFLVPEKDYRKLAHAIEYAIEHPEMWESMGRIARKKVEDEFETKAAAIRLEKIFYALLDY